MLNIVSRSVGSRNVGGQVKVFQNLVKGLDAIGYPYVVNRRLDAVERLWIHDDTRALREISKLPPNVKVIVGPNLYVLPRDIPPSINLRGAIYMQPSDWVARLWETLGFVACPIAVWPVGIDTDRFKPADVRDKLHILIYQKQRTSKGLQLIEDTVSNMGLRYEVLTYGRYKEHQYLELLARAKYVIWHGCHESQGLALQEAMSC